MRFFLLALLLPLCWANELDANFGESSTDSTDEQVGDFVGGLEDVGCTGEDCGSKTWKQVGKCHEQAPKGCLKKYPRTAKADSKCFFDKKVTTMFEKSEGPFKKCVDGKLHTGDRCLRCGYHHFLESLDQYTGGRSPFVRCTHMRSKMCTRGCKPVKGKQLFWLGHCTRTTMSSAFKAFFKCWIKAHHHAENDMVLLPELAQP